MPIIAIQKPDMNKYSSINLKNTDITWVKPQWVREGQKFYCPHCESEFIYVNGQKTITHFRHKVKCKYNYEPESDEHISMKQWCFDTIPLHNSIKTKELEFRIDNNIADVYFEFTNGIKLVIECQCSYISIIDMEQRTRNYNSKGIYVLWILGTIKFLKKDSTRHECSYLDDNIYCLIGSPNTYIKFRGQSYELQRTCPLFSEDEQTAFTYDKVDYLDRHNRHLCAFHSIKTSTISAKQTEKWCNDNYYMRVYYFIKNEIKPIHLHYCGWYVYIRFIMEYQKEMQYKLQFFSNNGFLLAKFPETKWW